MKQKNEVGNVRSHLTLTKVLYPRLQNGRIAMVFQLMFPCISLLLAKLEDNIKFLGIQKPFLYYLSLFQR